jgi:hypothetical protein
MRDLNGRRRPRVCFATRLDDSGGDIKAFQLVTRLCQQLIAVGDEQDLLVSGDGSFDDL